MLIYESSPPPVTVFGGGIGNMSGTDNATGDANVAHSVEVSESESDMEAPSPAAASAVLLDGLAQGALQ